MKKGMILGLASVAAAFVASAASAGAGATFFDLRQGTGAWDEALIAAGKTRKATFDFGSLADWGITDAPEPIDWRGAGGGRIPENFLPTNIRFQSNLDRAGGDGENPGGERGGNQPMFLLGPGQGFGNTKNFLGANFFADSTDIVFDTDNPNPKTAVDLVVSTVFDTQCVVTVFGLNEQVLAQVTLNGTGNAGYRLGILAGEGQIIKRINLDSPALFAEGVQGAMSIYENIIPAPGALALVGLAGLVSRRRRTA
jgi:hypothetical protein